MIFLSIGTVRRIQFEYKDNTNHTSTHRSIPLFFPFAFVFFAFQNFRILLAPMNLPKIVIAKICLRNILQFRFEISAVTFFKLFFIHCLLIPRTAYFPVQLQESRANRRIWTSRHALVQGFSGEKFSSILEEELKVEFTTNKIQMWGQLVSNFSDPKIENWGIRSKLSLERVPKSEHFVLGQINFVDIPISNVINGSYVISSGKYVNTLPYESDWTNSYPQRDIIINNAGYFGQNYELVGTQKSGLFLGNSNNWYHFLVEVLPRGITWNQKNDRSLSVVFNRDTPENILKIISLIGRTKPTLIRDGESVFIENLTIATDGRYTHQADMHRIREGKNIFLDRISDLNLVSSWMRENFKKDQTKSPNLVLLIRGPNKSRRLQNAEELQTALEKLGFVTVNPEFMSIEDQINLFENVEMMIAEGGAALTNLIFAKKMRLLIHIEANPHPQVSGFWQQFSEVLGVPAVPYLGMRNNRRFKPTESYSIEVSELIKTLQTKLS